MNYKVIFLLFSSASVIMGCEIHDTCLNCTVNCFWVKFAVNAYCLEDPVYEVEQGIVIGPGEMALCAEFGTVETTSSPKSENTTNHKTSRSSSPTLSFAAVSLIVTALTTLLFLACYILWILKLNRRRRDWRHMYPSVTYANDVSEVSVRFDI